MVTPKNQPTGEALQFMQGLWALVHALDVRSKRMAQSLGVTGPQRLVLRVVGRQANQTASELATTLGKHPSTLTGTCTRCRRSPSRALRAHAGRQEIDKLQRGTVEAAVRRTLLRVDASNLDGARDTLAMRVEELSREE